MVRRLTTAQKEKEYRYAQAADAYRRRTDIALKPYSGRRPLSEYSYRPIFYRTGAALDETPRIIVKASELAVTKIGISRLNIVKDDAALNTSIQAPTAFEPSYIKAVSFRAGNPADRVAYAGTGRPYRKYAVDSTAAVKASSTAPVCVATTDTTPTLQELMLTIRSIVSDKAVIVGANGGSISYSLETLREVEF